MTQPYLRATTININSTPTAYFSSPIMIPTVAGSYNYAAFWPPLDTALSIGGVQYYYTGVSGVPLVETTLTSSYIPLTPQVVFAPSDNAVGAGKLLTYPTGYTLLWSWGGAVYAWQPVAPAGYIALGVVFTSTSAVPTPSTSPTSGAFPHLMCVRQDLCALSSLNPSNMVWLNNFSLTPAVSVSVWKLPNATSSIVVSSGWNYSFPPGYNSNVPPEVTVWDLKQPPF